MRKLFAFIMSLLLLALFAPFAAPAMALNHTDECGDSAPRASNRLFEVIDHGNNWSDTAHLDFSLTRSEVRALQCVETLTIEFRMTGYKAEVGQTQYSFSSETLSTGNTSTWSEDGHVIVMSVEIDVEDLHAHHQYDIALEFGGFFPVAKGEMPHEMTVHWVTSELQRSEYEGECEDKGAETIVFRHNTFCNLIQFTELARYNFGY